MAKHCELVDDLENPECPPYSGGQCEGTFYQIRWTYDLVIWGEDSTAPGTYPMEMVTGYDQQSRNWMKGPLGCISSPLVRDFNRYIIASHTVSYINHFGNRITKGFIIGESFLLPEPWRVWSNIENIVMVAIEPKYGGNDDCGDFIPPQKLECHCDPTDEEISCSSEAGGICCISKSLIDQLCNKI
jgi:hypothetical protein